MLKTCVFKYSKTLDFRGWNVVNLFYQTSDKNLLWMSEPKNKELNWILYLVIQVRGSALSRSWSSDRSIQLQGSATKEGAVKSSFKCWFKKSGSALGAQVPAVYCIRWKDLRIVSSFISFMPLKKGSKGSFYGTSSGKRVSQEASNGQLEGMTVTSRPESLRLGKMVEETGWNSQF